MNIYMNMHVHSYTQTPTHKFTKGTEYLKEDKNLRAQVISRSLLISDKNDKDAKKMIKMLQHRKLALVDDNILKL